MTIKNVSEKFNISQDTLRYYEKIGMIPRVNRNRAGIREYEEEDLKWVELSVCMRSAGIPIKVMTDYVNLYIKGDETIKERLKLLSDQKTKLLEQEEQIKIMLNKLNYKIKRYEDAIKTGNLEWS